jgi:outer membrane cobalamin receptor
MMKKILFIISFFICCQSALIAQQIQGTVQNAKTLEPMAELQISINNQQIYTDAQGKFACSLPVGLHNLQINADGFLAISLPIKIMDASTIVTKNILLQKARKEMNTITVSGSRFQKRAAEEIVSIEIVKPEFIKNAAINRVDDALNKMPGITVIDNQINIRGGAGWSYGAGSRVMVMLDDMPMLTADAQDAKWDFLPIENCEQIEVMKGAASTLYGSSALNGVVHFKTAYARNKPTTKVQLFNGMFGNPANKNMIWWGKKQPSFGGGYASHSRKIGQSDLVLGSAWFSEDSYLQGDATRRIRFNGNFRHRVKNVPGLVLNLNGNIQLNKSSTFFLHDADTSLNGLLSPFGGVEDSTTTLNKNNGTRANIDPIITYYSSKGWQHHLRTRYLFTQNLIPEKKQTSTGRTYYGEYQVVKKWNDTMGWRKNLNVIAGFVGTQSSVTGELYGQHQFTNLAQYAQLEKKIGKVWLVGGARLETNLVDTYKVETKSVFRGGANYEPIRGTNFRASWGQGYRYPTIAERFVQTNFGASSVFPNPGLVSEQGWSAELGVKQGFAIGKLIGYLDAAYFRMQYTDMMEFNFGFNNPKDSAQSLKYLGFQSRNIGDTRITGLDASVFAQYMGKEITHNFVVGYTYINPVQIDITPDIIMNYSTDRNILKYRYQHTIKATWDLSYKGFSFATINTINSPMVNIDGVFEKIDYQQNPNGFLFEGGTSKNGQYGSGLPSTIKKFRSLHNNWTWIGDLRLSYQISKQSKVAFVVKNVGNTQYYSRPALIGPIRNFTFQLFTEL